MDEPWVWWMHWIIIGVKPAYYLNLFFWNMWHPEISFLKNLSMGSVLYPIKAKKSMALFHIRIFPCHFALLLKRKLQHVSHKWVICGSHPDCSVGQWVKWINWCDTLSTLDQNISVCLLFKRISITLHYENYHGIHCFTNIFLS